MFVKNLRLKGIRNFENVFLEFSSGMNLLVGGNNSGKSTIIKGVYKMQQIDVLDNKSINAFVESGEIVINFTQINENDFSSFKLKKDDFSASVLKRRSLGFVFNMFINNDIRDEALIHVNGPINEKHLDDRGVLSNSLVNFYGLSDTKNNNNFIYPFFSKRRNEHASSQVGTLETFSVN